MRTLRLLLEYDGTRYAGWQRQPRAPSIQATLEDAAARLLQAPHRVVGAGRTDAGVHALGQVAHLATSSTLAPDRIRDGLNALTPPDIVVRGVEEAPAGFHARRDARLRVYRYAVLARARPSALLRHYTHHVASPLDLDAMKAGAASLTGRHDFTAFRVSGTATASTTCTIATLRVERRGDFLLITVAADRFLRQMVRRIVGTLLRVGHGALPPAEVAAILAAQDNRRAGPAVPACGLYLVRVQYETAALEMPPHQAPQGPVL
jgi:tRNA pseudouridine38-40 synthase